MDSEQRRDPPLVLLVDDDPDDLMLFNQAVRRSGVDLRVSTVEDGAYVVDYLEGQGTYAGDDPIRPDLILMDLNMPMVDGFTAIARLKANEKLRGIPILVLTTSRDNSDVARAYDVGAASFLTKPNQFDQLIELVRLLRRYWFEVAALPAIVA